MVSKKRMTIITLLTIFAVAVIAAGVYFPRMLADEIAPKVYPLKYADFIKTYSAKYDVDPALVAAVIFQESRFNPNAVSPVGAQGLMQFMPGTAATMAKETGHWPKYNIFDAETSVEFGAAHLRDLLNKYDGDVDQALAGYNAGTGTVDRWLALRIFEKVINGGSKSETVSYVRKVKNYQTVYATMYPEELGIKSVVELKTVDIEQKKAEVRGFVWSQVFSSVFSFGR